MSGGDRVKKVEQKDAAASASARRGAGSNSSADAQLLATRRAVGNQATIRAIDGEMRTSNQSMVNSGELLQDRAADAGNQASPKASQQGNRSLESITFPFFSAWGEFSIGWSGVEDLLDAQDNLVRDDAALFIVKRLREQGDLEVVASDPRGRRILVRLYDELTSGSVWDDERAAADSVALVLKRSIDPKTFLRLSDAKAAPVIPISEDGFTHGSWVQAKRLPNGNIFIKPNSSNEDWNYKKNYPDFFEYYGAEFDPRDVINVVLTDVSPTPKQILAVEFLAFANASEYELLKKSIEAAVAGATLPFSAAGLGGRGLLEGAAANSPRLARALSLTSGVSESSMTLARGVSSTIEFADAAAIAWGGVSFFVHSIERSLIRRFGNEGKELLAWVNLLDGVTLIYGFSRIAADAANLIHDIRQRAKALRDVASRSAIAGSEDMELANALEVIVDKTDELTEQERRLIAEHERQVLEIKKKRLTSESAQSSNALEKGVDKTAELSDADKQLLEFREQQLKGAPSDVPGETSPAWMIEANADKSSRNGGELRATLQPPGGDRLSGMPPEGMQLAPKKPVPSNRIPEKPTSGQLGSQVNDAEQKGGAGREVTKKRKDENIAVKKQASPESTPTADEVQSKRLRNAQESLSAVGQALISTANDAYVIEQVTILGVRSKQGFVPTSKLVNDAIVIKQPGRIVDIAEVPKFSLPNKELKAETIIFGDYKSADRLAYLDAHKLTKKQIEQAAGAYQGMVGPQLAKENAILKYATENNGDVLFGGTVVGTKEKIIFFANPADVRVSAPLPYGGALRQ